jgi:hypothetical protein
LRRQPGLCTASGRRFLRCFCAEPFRKPVVAVSCRQPEAARHSAPCSHPPRPMVLVQAARQALMMLLQRPTLSVASVSYRLSHDWKLSWTTCARPTQNSSPSRCWLDCLVLACERIRPQAGLADR